MANAKDSLQGTTWKVLPHGPLEQVGTGLWRVEGSLEKMPLQRVMAVVRQADGGLLIHNAMALSEEVMTQLEKLGKIATIVVPNGWHRLDAPRFHHRYPHARVICPPGSRKKVEELVPVTKTYEHVPSDGVVSFETLDGTRGMEGAVIVRHPQETSVILTDAVFNMPHKSGVQGFILRHLTQSSGGPKTSRIARIALIKDKLAFRHHLQRLASLPHLERVLVAHHEMITEDAAGTLQKVANSLA